MIYKLQPRSGWTLWAVYAVVAWCVAFGALHLYWALGGNAGLALFSTPDNQTVALTRDPLYMGLTWAVGIICVYGAGVALATIQTWGRHIPRWIVLTTLWIACGLCLVRGIGNPVQTLLIISGLFPFDDITGPSAAAWYRWMLVDAIIFSPWFTLGGLSFGITAWSARRQKDPPAALRSA
jgi:hypothetical protein